MAQTVTINAERRRTTGKGGARQLRRAGKVPAVIYGHGREPEPLTVIAQELDRALIGIAAESVVIDLAVDGAAVKTLIREIQRHPTRKDILHVDFYEVHAGEKITLGVPIHLEGSPEGVRNSGGVLEQFLRELEIEVLPTDIPSRVVLDVTDLAVGHSLHVSDVQLPGVRILDDPETTICTVVPPRVEEEPPAEVVAEEPAEPELIRKPKDEEEAADESETED